VAVVEGVPVCVSVSEHVYVTVLPVLTSFSDRSVPFIINIRQSLFGNLLFLIILKLIKLNQIKCLIKVSAYMKK